MNETTKEDDYFQAGSFHQVDNICKDSNSHFSYPAGLHITNESIKIHEELTFPQFLLVLTEVNNTSLHHLCRDLHELSCPVIERSFKLTGSFSSASDLSLGGECFGSVDGEGCSSVIDDDTLKSFPNVLRPLKHHFEVFTLFFNPQLQLSLDLRKGIR